MHQRFQIRRQVDVMREPGTIDDMGCHSCILRRRNVCGEAARSEVRLYERGRR
jgi:hypothetical protein